MMDDIFSHLLELSTEECMYFRVGNILSLIKILIILKEVPRTKYF